MSEMESSLQSLAYNRRHAQARLLKLLFLLEYLFSELFFIKILVIFFKKLIFS